MTEKYFGRSGQGRIIAMWSGPRNLSTAMMRSFSARGDCDAVDEPFYAAYLQATGLEHPMREAVIASQPTDPAEVVLQCLTAPQDQNRIFYQKHMTHHMIDGFDTGWLAQVTNVFLIRAPERVLASYAAKTEQVTAADIGFLRQRELFDEVHAATGSVPAVIDATDIRRSPSAMLEKLCDAIGIAFDPAMLCWPEGPHKADGVWAAHWYDSVWRSTGFAPPEAGAPADLPDDLAAIAWEVRPHYEHLRRHALQA
ncbi:sulfotransferase family protein [Salaquimonas pukyongi]|uniref:sulfotransferase-like domain-containing protein n=1 Tax=Salaquimonas pukyongi TaxID=2712698 RepID=UPI00096BA5E0|nr:sulfotransferase family protein [Salaquimonas pukyongi]